MLPAIVGLRLVELLFVLAVGSVIFIFISASHLPLELLAALWILWLLGMYSTWNFDRLPAGKAATDMWAYWQGNPRRVSSQCPQKLLGVWWFSDNPAPELIVSFEGATFDPSTRVMTLVAYGEFNWSIDDNCLGYFTYAILAALGNSIITFRWNEDFTFADMPLYLFRVIPIPKCLLGFTITQLDEKGERWARATSVLNRPYDYGSYTLVKIVDHTGEALPALSDMEQSLKDQVPVKGTSIRSPTQAIHNPYPCLRTFKTSVASYFGANKASEPEAAGLIPASA